jgi:SAM-dependent methyltransferase
VAEDYWKTVGRVPSSLGVDPAFAALIDPGVSVLDLGCGDGRTLAELAAAVPRGREFWAGVDVNREVLARAASRGLVRTGFVLADIAALPFADGRFDYGVMHAVLTTLVTPAERRAVLAEAFRVLRRGLYVSDFLLTPDQPLYRERYARGLVETGSGAPFGSWTGSDTCTRPITFRRRNCAGFFPGPDSPGGPAAGPVAHPVRQGHKRRGHHGHEILSRFFSFLKAPTARSGRFSWSGPPRGGIAGQMAPSLLRKSRLLFSARCGFFPVPSGGA